MGDAVYATENAVNVKETPNNSNKRKGLQVKDATGNVLIIESNVNMCNDHFIRYCTCKEATKGR